MRHALSVQDSGVFQKHARRMTVRKACTRPNATIALESVGHERAYRCASRGTSTAAASMSLARRGSRHASFKGLGRMLLTEEICGLSLPRVVFPERCSWKDVGVSV
jgi:hypothetical protein